ncbi:nuclear transport factor 2 family protein [Streptomyces sp. NPDC046261]|uniref:nuclear transport factor 2 family protein n=1 Tax=Streptomyces sp. NPDC046261 TaxID=3157200 RepID=UPI0033FBAD88
MTTPPAERSADVLVGDLFQVIDNRRWADLASVFAEDAVYERPGYEPLEGLARIRRFYEHERVIAAGRHHVEHVAGGAEAVACWGRFLGSDKDGGALDEAFADTYVLRDGKILRRKTFFFRPAI